MDVCRDYQKEGNAFYSEGQYERASIRYHHAITYFEYAIADNDDMQEELDQCRLPVYSNYSACMLKLNRFDEAMNYSSQVLRIDPNSVKAMYRQAQVLRQKDELERAEEVVGNALLLSPKNVALKSELCKIQYKKESYQRNSQKMGMKMFGSLNKKKNTKMNTKMNTTGGNDRDEDGGGEKLTYVVIA